MKTAAIFSRSASLKAGQQVAIAGRIQSSRLRMTRRPGFKIFEALIGDATGSIMAVWMNQSFLQDILRRDVHVVLFGAVEARPRLQVTNPDYEVIDAAEGDAEDPEDASTVHTGRIVPVYEKAGAMTPKMQRRLVFDASRACRPICRIRFPRTSGGASSSPIAARRSSKPISPVRTRRQIS